MRCIACSQAGIPLDGASDHGVSEALYLRDPDENGVELYWDRPRSNGRASRTASLAMFTQRLDLDDLLRQGGLVRTWPLHEPQDPSGCIKPDAEPGMRE